MGSCSSVPAELRVSVVLGQRVCLGIVPYLHLVLDHPYACKPYLAAAAAKSLQSCPTLCNPIDGSPPGSPQSLGFSRQEHWSGLPFPFPVHESEKSK